VSQPRLEAIRLEYGCHSGRFELPDEGRPVVIAGRNGAGKTTLLEAFLRTLYGFNRRKTEDKNRLDRRQPWSGRPAAAEVWLTSADGRHIRVFRDFASDEVVAVEEDSGVELFRGDGNPVGARSESRHYQNLLREWIGFGTLEPYRGSAWIAQGELIDTKLDDELLRAAAGTHRRVETALKELRDGFEALTREPMELGGRRKNRSRELEDARDLVEAAVRRLEISRAARERKRPLLEREREVRREVDSLASDIALLEAAYRPITERRTLIAERAQAESRLASLSEAARRVEQAAGELARAEAEAKAAEADAGGPYPDDFEMRLGQAEVLWDRRDRLRSVDATAPAPDAAGRRLPLSGPVFAGAVLALVGAGVGATLSPTAGSAIVLIGLALMALGAWADRSAGEADSRDRARRREEDLEAIEAQLTAIAAAIPGPLLTPASLPEHRRKHRRQADARSALLRARERHAEAAEQAAALLAHDPSAAEGGSDSPGSLVAAREEARTALARVQLRLEEQPATPALPAGVEPTVAAVEAARKDRRTRRDALSEELTRLDLDLRDLDRAAEDVFALERQVTTLRQRVTELEDEVSVRRLAWELVRDAYEEFRSTDQERLVNAIDRRMRDLSGGRLGPVEAPADLTTASVGLDGRMVDLDSPPLSFGEKHAALLAIRLGAADFLSGDGAHHPLLVDEPFTHLDEVRSGEVWEVLKRLAVGRQVIVTTQDRLVLDHLEIEPDFELEVPSHTAGETVSPPAAPAADGRVSSDGGPTTERSPDAPDRSAPAAVGGSEPPSERASGPVQAQLELG